MRYQLTMVNAINYPSNSERRTTGIHVYKIVLLQSLDNTWTQTFEMTKTMYVADTYWGEKRYANRVHPRPAVLVL